MPCRQSSIRKSECRAAPRYQAHRSGRVTLVPFLRSDRSRPGSGFRGATLVMLAKLLLLRKDDGGSCLRDTERVKTLPRALGNASVSAENFGVSTRGMSSGNVARLLIWRFLARATKAGLGFNPQGIILESNVLLLTGVGGAMKPRSIVSKSAASSGISRYVKGLVQSVLARPASRGESDDVRS
jgi:hypothetical protein